MDISLSHAMREYIILLIDPVLKVKITFICMHFNGAGFRWITTMKSVAVPFKQSHVCERTMFQI